jgi:hypothetical protein
MRRPYYLIKRSVYWYYRLNRESGLVENDDVTWHSTGCQYRGDAEQFLEDLLTGGRYTDTPAKYQTFRQYAEPYFEWERCPHIRRLREEGKSITRRHAMIQRQRLKKHILPDPFADKRMPEITRADVLDLRSRLLTMCSPATVNKALGIVKVIFREAVYREEINRDPTAGVGRIKEHRKERGIFTVEELRVLFPDHGYGPWRDVHDYTCFYSEKVLLKLPHRQFVFTLPKLLRPFFKYDRNLFEEVSRIIFSIIHDFYSETVKTRIKTGVVVSYQSFGDLMRWNPHYHCLVLEGGIDERSSFHHIPIKDTSPLTEVFRRRILKLFVERGLLDSHFARKILSWKHSGFSVDNSVPIPASSRKARVNLSQYIVRHPVSLQKILYARSNGTIIYKTKYNVYWKENIKLFKANDFIAELTQHIPPKHKHLIRYYGLYSSRTKGKAHKDCSLAKFRCHAAPKKKPSQEHETETIAHKASRPSWARLIQKVYEVDPLICEKCGHEMKVIAVITNSHEVRKILECLKRNNAPPFDKVEIKAS